ncbi:hypothetical protein FGE12_20830 [Aggregicoccus sp. 17bor-14]|uniref:alpha-2-macroglobulin family protein n=1 Tax=Myxococcaceae TaxID=31 RepID=UPI00129C9288|nr:MULTISPECIES: MG2 domain-containing protein [Myxococcaceae]MBF5044858.1 hypothetical protein [Simulacricoccus sp. 17bor-14]MRI90601.1 hypothetical protein [Aggregicoccus sp. 17bor-14]
MLRRLSPTHRPRALLLRLAVGATLALAACKGEKPSAPPSQPASPGAARPAPGEHPAPAPEDLTPAIREQGPEGGLPTQVVLELPRAIAPANGKVGEGTRLVITPEVRGHLEFRGASTLVFTALQPLAFDTAYSVALSSLQVGDRVVSAPGTDAWHYRFRTPAFAFQRLALQRVDLKGGKVEGELRFTGPVDFAQVRRLGVFEVGGEALTAVTYRDTPGRPSVVTVSLTGARLRAGATLRFRLREGLRPASAAGASPAPAAQDEVALRGGKRLQIYNAYVQEGPMGHYVEVACRNVDDHGNEQGKTEDEGAMRGCSLGEEAAAEAVHFDPQVKFSVAPSRWGFRIFGDFKRGTYALRIDAGATSTAGGVLLATYEESFSISAREPRLSFSTGGRYLPRSAWRNLPLNHLNVDTVELTVRQVPPENLVFWMSNDEQETADERTSNVLTRKTLAVRAPADTQGTTYVDVAGLVPASTRGLVQLTATQLRPNGERGASASSRILLTDLSLVAKRSASGQKGEGDVQVWALGMESTELLSGVEVTLVKKSGQSVARCSTKGAEGCRLQVPAQGVDDSAPFALVARQGEELTYLKYSELKTEVAESDVQGVAWRAESPYRAALYSDRGVYRPGDTAHVVALLRGADDRAPPAGLPVDLRIVDPREREVKKSVLATNAAGLVSLDLRFEPYQDTGRYSAVLRVADRVVAKYPLNVEEFVPERMKVSATVSGAGYGPQDEIPVSVSASYLFGGSAEGSPVQLTCRLEPSVFKPAQNAQYSYGVWRPSGADEKASVLGQLQGTLDAKGEATLSCPAQRAAGGFKGPARLVAQASVFESGSGRSTLGEARVPVHPERYYVGLLSGVQKVEGGKPFEVKGLVVDWNGQPVTDAKGVKPLEVEYLRLEAEYGYTFDEEAGEERYQRFLRPVREGRAQVQLENGRFRLQVTPAMDAAGYLVRVTSGAAQTDLQLEGSGGYYWWEGENARVDQTPRPMKPTSLGLEVPALARVGEPLQLRFKAPYRGRVLLTAETDHLLASEWRQVEPGEVTWTFTPQAFAPNVYVSAFLVKDPHLESKEAFLPDRAFGVSSVPVEPTAFTQRVKLQVPAEVRSGQELEVGLELGPQEGPTVATVAVVDEGILSLTRFQSPDPLKALFAKRALAVETYETLGWTLLLPPQGASRSTGGDEGGEGAGGRVQPVKPVSLWSGVVEVPASGKAQVRFKLPQYRGQLRVMAVTAGPQRVGRASAAVRVSDPLVLQATLPRFLSQGDQVQVPVFVTNLSGKAQDVTVRISAESLDTPGLQPLGTRESPLQLVGKSEGRVRLENGKAATLVFQARAAQAMGAAKLRVTASGGGFTSQEELDVPFLPAGPRERRVQRIELAEGTLELAPSLQGWLPTSERSTLWVTTHPYAESLQHLSYLVHYPYGCIEQTTSSTRPLLYVSGLLDSIDPTLTAGRTLEEMVQAGLARILSMQTPSGGFGYWPGDSEPVAWGSAYATHLLLDAKEAGYAVPQERLDEALAYLGRELTRAESRRGALLDGHYAQDAEPYLHYVLSMAGKGRKARIQKLVEAYAQKPAAHPGEEGERQEQLYMLQAALYRAGDRRYESALRHPDASRVTDVRSNGWSFYSDRRRRGFMLSTFHDLFGNDPGGEPLARSVAEGLQGQRSGGYTTQELVWGVTGLGKWVQKGATHFTPPVLSAGGKALAPQENKRARSSDRTWSLARASERPELKLQVKEKGEGALYLVVASDGVRADGQYRYGGEGLSVRRTYRTLKGDVVQPTSGGVALADLLYVEVELENRSGERIQNIALVDRLPAGWELENARLGRGGGVEWAQPEQQWKVDALNLRDDRVEVFGALEAREKRKVIYAVRAVTAGHFTLPPVEAEAMYDPRIWARAPGGEVEVTGPWKDFLL